MPSSSFRSAGCSEHLRNYIFNDHSVTHFELIKQELFIQFPAYNAVFVKSMADQQNGIAHITLHRQTVHIKLQPDVWSGRIITKIYKHCVIKPEKRVLIVTKSCAFTKR